MTKILGLDLGTNSIGWAVVEDENGECNLPNDSSRPHKGVHVFSEGVKLEKGNEKSRAAERTAFRSARKIKFRRKIRKYQTLKALINAKPNRFCPLAMEDLKLWRNSIDTSNGKIRSFKQYPKNEEFLKWLKTDDSTRKNPYYFRDKFSRERCDWENSQAIAYELGRAFYHLAQRRGFASNKIDTGGEDKVEDLRMQLEIVKGTYDENTTVEDLRESLELFIENFKEEEDKKVKNILRNVDKILKERHTDPKIILESIESILNKRENLGKVKQNIADLNDKIEQTGCQTLGQYFYILYQDDRHKAENKIRTNYTGREEHYLKEFETICNIQQLPKNLTLELKKAIFYQRPLKSQKGLVGKCSFESSKPRCPVSHPDFEEYRMWSFINNIEVKEDNKFRKLHNEEKEKILEKFYRKKVSFDFKEIARIIRTDYPKSSKEEPDPFKHYFNYKGNTSVSGCPITAELMSIFGRKWEEKINWREQLYESWKNKTYINGKARTQKEVLNEFWHALFNADLLGDKKELIGKSRQDKLRDFAERNTNLTPEQVRKFSNTKGLKKEYANLSLHAIQKISKYLKQGLIYSHAVFMANMEKVVDREIWKDKKSQWAIRQGIDKILETHSLDMKVATVINTQLKECRENNYTYSKATEAGYLTDIEKRLIDIFGKRGWNKLTNKDDILQSTHRKFIERLKRNMGLGEFLKIERIDERIISFIKGENENGVVYCSDEKQLENLYHPSDIERFKPVPLKENGKVIIRNGKPLLGLGSPTIPSIKNPMAMRTLHQLRKLINELLKEDVIDEKTKVHIELARELNDANKRAAIRRYQEERKKQRELYRAKIQELYQKETGKNISPTDDDVFKFSFWVEQDPEHTPSVFISDRDIERYQYWDEQYHRCIYTGKTISLSDFIGPNPKFDIEHTIPRSVSFDNSQMNKTLCYNKYNRGEKAGKLPIECKNYENAETIVFRDGEQCDCPAISIGIIERWKEKYTQLDNQVKLLIKRSKSASTKEQKDKIIQERHYVTLHHDYWKGKYERFTMEEVNAGFKNSQKVDTGIITRYAREFLASLFKNKSGNSNVHSVNGQLVDVFRKAWGLHEKELDEYGKPIFDNHGIPVYKEKDRSNHVHHCIDAITIACMTKDKYDMMAHAWGMEDKGQLQDARKEMEMSKPWVTFTEDLKEIENEVAVVHYKKDNAPKQAKKKLRKRGRVQYKDKEKKEPIYLKGDTIRGSLHQDTFYGAVKQPDIDEKTKRAKYTENGVMILVKDKGGNDAIHYVIRKKLEAIKGSEIDKIVDREVKERVRKAVEDGILKISPNDQQKNKILGKIWMNEKKGVEIKKVRVFFSKTPMEIKDHAELSKSRLKHKQKIYALNDENYCMAIYEGISKKGKIERASELVNMKDAGDYYKLSNKNHRRQYSIVPEIHGKTQYPLKVVIKKGQMVLLYDKYPDEIWEMTDAVKMNYLYEITQLDTEGQSIKLMYHQEARENKEITQFMGLKNGMKGGKLIGKFREFPWIKVSPNQFDALVEGVDFKITPTGKIIKL